jgi:hypothetical protein
MTIKQDGWTLVDEAGTPARIGQRITNRRGDNARLVGAVPPHRPGTSGKLWTEENGALYYVGVWGLRWVNEAGHYFGDGKGA